jgi:translation initiation factor 2B subunit (eIF-2B alpha/beta/delta family)
MNNEMKNYQKKIKELKMEVQKPEPNPVALENIIDALKRFINSERRRNGLQEIKDKDEWELMLKKYDGYLEAIEIIRKSKRRHKE